MDYSDDRCMYMFSAEQTNYMRWYSLEYLRNLIDKASTVLNGKTCPPVDFVHKNDKYGEMTLTWENLVESQGYEIALLEKHTDSWQFFDLDTSFFYFRI